MLHTLSEMTAGGRALAAALVLVAATVAAPARAETPALQFDLKNTTDLWRNVSGGVAVGDTSLDKLQVSATLNGDAVGLPGFKAHLFVFKTNGETLSLGRTGDIQTASNIEALSATRLFGFWAEQHLGGQGARGADLRVGLMDLNDTFDSIKTAGLFINSSHGIGPDLSRSGRNGPSIFPVSALGVQAAWAPRDDLSIHLAAFDGVPGDPARPKAFAAVKLSDADGALLIGQADWAFAPHSQASLGVWRYTASLPGAREPRPGVYAFVDAPLPGVPKVRGWLRAGFADKRPQTVSDYLGGGLVWTGAFAARPNDQLGLAIARAGLSGPPGGPAAWSKAEVNIEATYSFVVNRRLRVQPDLQYIRHPGLAPNQADAVALGLRVVFEVSNTPAE